MTKSMGLIDIDFQRDSPATGAAGIGLLLLGIVTAAAGLWWHAQIGSAIESVEAKIAEAKYQVRRTPAHIAGLPRDPRAMQQELRAANAVIRQMTIPWDRLFSELASSADDTIALLEVRPDAQTRQVRINGEAKNLQAMLAYSRRLEAGTLTGVMLLGHEIKTQDARRQVVFSMIAGWDERP